jgi:hypothetical protein
MDSYDRDYIECRLNILDKQYPNRNEKPMFGPIAFAFITFINRMRGTHTTHHQHNINNSVYQ